MLHDRSRWYNALNQRGGPIAASPMESSLFVCGLSTKRVWDNCTTFVANVVYGVPMQSTGSSATERVSGSPFDPCPTCSLAACHFRRG